MSSTQKTSKPEAPIVEKPRPMSDEEKDALIRSMISSMQIEGITISRDVAERVLERVLNRPVPGTLD